MSRNLVALIGEDQTGVVAMASKVLLDHGANLGQVSQMVLDNQFVSFFIYTADESLSPETVRKALNDEIARRGMDLTAVLRPVSENCGGTAEGSQPFVLCIWGQDCVGIIHAFSSLLGASRINIENLRAMQLPTGEYLARFEIALPPDINRKALLATLNEKARSMGLTVTMQHREIFEAVNRVKTF